MRISDWSSDVCSSDLAVALAEGHDGHRLGLPAFLSDGRALHVGVCAVLAFADFDRGWRDGCNEDRRETACGCGSGGVLRHDIQILQISSSPRGAFSRSEFLNFICHCREIAADRKRVWYGKSGLEGDELCE